MSPGIAQSKVTQRIAHRRGELLGDRRCQRHAERVAKSSRVFDREVALFSCNGPANDSSRAHQRREGVRQIRRRACRDLAGSHIADGEKQVVKAVDAFDEIARIESL